jgi:PPOX class probable F420-dependent enzyme
MAQLSRLEIEDYLAKPHVAHLVTVRPDGRPHVAPVWFLWEGGRALIITGGSSVKVRNIRRSPAVALSIATDQRPLKYVVLEGEGKVTQENLARVVERICVRYDGPAQGAAYARELLAAGNIVLVDIRVVRLIGWKDEE